MRWHCSLLVAALLGAASAHAGGEALSGNWKLTFFSGDEQPTLWIIRLEGKDAKFTGTAVAMPGVPPTKVKEVTVSGDSFAFALTAPKLVAVDFEAKLPRPGAKKIFGTLKLGNKLLPAIMEATAATSIFELNKEIVLRTPTDPRVFSAILDLLSSAKKEKATANEVKEWMETGMKTAQLFGPRMHEEFVLTMIEASQKDFPAQAASLARGLEAGLDAKAPADLRLRYLAILASALRKAEQADEAKAIESRIEKLEDQAHAEHEKSALPFKVEKFADKRKSNRVAVVELFTGAQCPPCIAADLAFDGLKRAFSPADVILLQHHLHIPGPDALTNPDTVARSKYYDDLIEGTPTFILNGKAGPEVGGLKEHAEDGYLALRKDLAPWLEKPATADIGLSAMRSGDKIDIKASVRGLETPSEKMKLRLFLVEDWARYRGANGLPYHSRVVREMPGGAAGFPLVKKDSEHTAQVDLGDLRKRLNAYLDKYGKDERPFPDDQRPMRLGNLSVVAIVQNDATREILQGAEVRVKD